MYGSTTSLDEALRRNGQKSISEISWSVRFAVAACFEVRALE